MLGVRAYIKVSSLAFAWLFLMVWMDRAWVEQHGRNTLEQSNRTQQQVGNMGPANAR